MVVESGRYAVAHSDEAMVGRMAAGRAEMMDARTVGLKVYIRGITMVGL